MEEFEELRRRFRRESERRTGLRYPAELRQVAVDYATLAFAQGASRRETARSLGLTEATLLRWQERHEAAGAKALHEVVVVGRAGVSSTVLVMPSGTRVEGLSVADLLVVLEALG